MNNIHICTTKSLRAGIEQEPRECLICGHNTVFSSWVGSSCDTCGNDYGHTIGIALMRIREKLNLTRKQLGLIIGYSPKTIKSYEWKIPSEAYIDKFKKFVKEQYKNES